MKRAKKKKVKTSATVFPYFDPTKHYTVSGQKLNEWRDSMADESVKKSTMITIGVLASELNWNEDKIVEFYGDISRKIGYANNGNLSCEDVEAIIEKHTGMKFENRWY